ncbi:acyltransferase family protein [Candidatus Binatia bacterium]|nr:acyltransferase family protein [Candidatus Binatia bacterium]
MQHERFAERLRALESEVERAVAESGGESAIGGYVTDGIEAVLASYARVAREVESGAGRLSRLLGFGVARDGRAIEDRALDDGLRRDRAHDGPTLDDRAHDGPTLDDRAHDGPTLDDRAHDGPTLDDDPLLGLLLRGLYHAWFRVEVSGLENVPRTGRVLLVANHSGGLFPHDAAMLTIALEGHRTARRDARPLVDDHVCNLPLLSELARRIGGVRARPENAERLLADDQAVIAFPEGVAGLAKPYAQRYRVRRFGRGTFVRAALRTGAPVVPVAVIGAEEAHPVLGRWDWLGERLGLPYFPLTPTFPWLGTLGLVPLPSKWRIEIGPPLRWSGRTDTRAGNAAHVARRNEEVRQQVQRLVAEALERRGHAFL